MDRARINRELDTDNRRAVPQFRGRFLKSTTVHRRAAPVPSAKTRLATPSTSIPPSSVTAIADSRRTSAAFFTRSIIGEASAASTTSTAAAVSSARAPIMREKNSAVSTISDRLASSATRSISAWTKVPKRGPADGWLYGGFARRELHEPRRSWVAAGFRANSVAVASDIAGLAPNESRFVRALAQSSYSRRARSERLPSLSASSNFDCRSPMVSCTSSLSTDGFRPYHAMIADFGRMQSWSHAFGVAAHRRRTVADELSAEFGTSGRFALER